MESQMPSNRSVKRIRAVIAATSSDDPVKVVVVAKAITKWTDFDLTIAGCAVGPLLDLPLGLPLVGTLTPAFAIEQYPKYECGEIQQFCRKVIKAVDETLPQDVKPAIGCINADLNQIVTTLASIFEIIVIPHALKISIKRRLRHPFLDTSIMKTKKVATLFCADTSACRRIVVVQVKGKIGFQGEQVLSRFADSLHVPVYRWFPDKRVRKEQPSASGQEQKLTGIPDNYELDSDSVLTEQPGTWLVVPSDVILALFRFRRLRLTLRKWRGNFLVLP